MVADRLTLRRGTDMQRPEESTVSSIHTSLTGARRHVRTRGLRWLALVPLVAFLALALLGPLLVTSSPTEQSLPARLTPPALFGGTWAHPLGTDGLGRDLLARVAVAARLSLAIGVFATALSAAFGVLLGLIAGVFGGRVDRNVSALVDVQLALPFVVVGFAVTATLGQSVRNVLLVLTVTGWVTFARVVRLQARVVRGSEYVRAAVAIGASPPRLMFRHVLPNVLPAVLVLISQGVGAVMLYEASLTYLGVGLPVDRITLGGLVDDGQDMIFQAWWVTTLPGIAVALAIVGFNLLGDHLQFRFRTR